MGGSSLGQLTLGCFLARNFTVVIVPVSKPAPPPLQEVSIQTSELGTVCKVTLPPAWVHPSSGAPSRPAQSSGVHSIMIQLAPSTNQAFAEDGFWGGLEGIHEPGAEDQAG